MLEMKLTRAAKRKTYTIGHLYVKKENDEWAYLCDTLEPTWRDYAHGVKKIKGRSAVPEGRYPVAVTWSHRFGAWLPLLVGVPRFSGIRIHAGNTAADTAGCILAGENKKRGMVVNSRVWLHRLMKILDARKEGEPAFITVE